MIELQLAQYRRARVWFNGLPDARPTSYKVSERSVGGGNVVFEKARQAAIEILIPRGPRALYGLLGAELRPSRSERLTVRVLVSSNAGSLFPGSIALASDETRIGLPSEFSQAVVEGAIEEITKTGGLGSGELLFDRAVHGSVGSAPIVFKWLAACLVQLLRECESITQQQIADILQSAI